MALTIGELVAYIRADKGQFSRELHGAEREFDSFGDRVGARIEAVKAGFSQAMGGLAGIARIAAVDAAASLVGPLGAAAGSLAAAFASAGAAAGAFGLAVAPQVSQISKVSQAYEKAQNDIAMGNATAAKSTAAYKKLLAGLPPATRATAVAFLGLKDDFKKWSESLAPKTMPILTKGIGILRSLLPALTPLVDAATDAFSGFMDSLAVGAKGGGVKRFTTALATAARQTLPAFLRSIKNIGVGLAGILRAFLPFSGKMTGGIEALTAKFAAFGQSLGQNPAFIKFMQDASAKAPLLISTLGSLAQIIINVTSALAPFTGATLIVTAALAKFVASIPPGVMDWLAPAIAGIVLGIRAWAVAQGILNIALAANPIGLIVLAIAGLVAAIVIAYKRSATFRDIVQGAWRVVQDAIGGAIRFVKPMLEGLAKFFRETLIPAAQAVGDSFGGIGQKALDAGTQIAGLNTSLGGTKGAGSGVIDWFKANWAPVLGTLLAGPLGLSVGLIYQYWGQIKSAFSQSGSWLAGHWQGIWNGMASILRHGLLNIVNAIQASMIMAGAKLLSPWPGIQSAFFSQVNRLSTAARNGVNKVAAVFAGLPHTIIRSLGNLGGLLVSAGAALIHGLIAGIDSAVGGLMSKLRSITNSLPSWKGPPSKDRKILVRNGRLIIRGLIDGMTGEIAGIKAYGNRVLKLLEKQFGKWHTRGEDRALDRMRRNTGRLIGLAKQRDAIAARIAEARKFAADTANNARSFASITSIDMPFNNPGANAQSLASGLAQRLATIKAFAANIARLTKMGLNKSTLRQILEAGPEQGGAIAGALAAGGKGAIGQINKTQAEIDKAANSLGRTGADALYDAGKNAGKGFLTGLQSQMKAIEAQMREIAKAMARAIRKALKIKSPSRVMADIGSRIAEGLQAGMTDGEGLVAAAADMLARAAVPGPAGLTPAAAPAGASSGGGSFSITLRIGDRELGELIIDPLRKAVQTRGGNVQATLGKGS